MTDFAALDTDDLGVDRIATSPTAFAFYENLFAFAEKAAGAPVLADQYVVTAMLADLGVTTAKIAAANVTSAKLASTSNERNWILALLAGLTQGAVGTLVFAEITALGSVAFGSTIAGSSLEPGNVGGTNPGAALSGTWKCLGYATGGNAAESTTLWIRTA